MERFQHKTTHAKVNTFSRPKSTPHHLLLSGRTLGQENLQVPRRAEHLEIVSDSSSCNSYSAEEDSFSYRLRRSGSNQTSEAPMKKLLAEELSKEIEPRRRTPSVIGRLMGLDALPPQQPIKKQQKKFSESYLKKTASIGYLDKKSSSDGRSLRTRSKEQQEFKDVFEVLESSRPDKHPDLLVQKARTNSNETNMEYVRQKFMDVKRLSTDEKLQQSKEFHDALDVLDSNKELLLKFLQEPDSLFAKRLHDLHGVASPPQSGHRDLRQSSNTHANLYRKPDIRREQNDVANSFQKHEQGAISHSRRKNVYIPSKGPKSRVHEKDATCQLPTRIVVLKPSLKKVHNTMRPVSSPDSSGDFLPGHRKNREFGSSESLGIYEEVRHRRDSSFELELMRHKTRGSREIAKEITRQMRHSVSSDSKRLPCSRLRVHAEDDSSYSLSGDDSPYEPEAKTPTSRHFNDWKSRYSPSSSYSTESSVSREAKKRLTERWKMTHRFQEVEKVSRGSTLAEMLAMPEKETRLPTSESIVSPDGFTNRLSRTGVVNRCVSPLGISSRDGWKDECVRSLPRSRSLPASSTCLSSPKTSTRNGSLGKDTCLLPNESVNWHTNNSRKLEEQRIGNLSKSNMKSCRKKSICAREEKNHPVQDSDLKPDEKRCMSGEKNHSVHDADLKPDELRVNFKGVDLSEWKPTILDIPVDDLAETTTSPNDRELSPDNSNPENTPIGPTERSSIFSQCTITDSESPASSKEAGQPSPVSVLEPPFVEESSSSSDCFEKVSADLHGLRLQLHLLKLESSDAYSEGSDMIVSSEEDIREDDDTGETNKDFSYVVDILVESGFRNADLDAILETRYSPELPIPPSVFDNLEKKYGDQMSWPRCDRRFLFDRTNFGLMELLQPWVNPGKTIGVQWKGERVVEELSSLLGRHDKDLGKESSLDEALMKEMKWLDVRDDITIVGTEIERLLFDDLVVEIVGCLVT